MRIGIHNPGQCYCFAAEIYLALHGKIRIAAAIYRSINAKIPAAIGCCHRNHAFLQRKMAVKRRFIRIRGL